MRILYVLFIYVFLSPMAEAAKPVDVTKRPECRSVLVTFSNIKHPVTLRLMETYFHYATQAQEQGTLPRFLHPEFFSYILDGLNFGEQLRLIHYLQRGGHATDHALEARLKALVDQVIALKRQHKQAVRLALQNHDHKGQRYGKLPYSAHLRKVRGVLKRFGFGPKDSLLGLRVGTVAWLHDIIEDTSVTSDTIRANFDKKMADFVSALTNEPDRTDISQEDRKRLTFERVARFSESRLVKLADRITNVEESLKNFYRGEYNKIDKYRIEWPLFKQYIYRAGEAEKMWQHLEQLLTDDDYGRRVLTY